jgi:hypothetical protein
MFVESRWNAMAHGDAREGKWRGNWRIEWVASTLHTTSERGVSIITTADAHTSAANSRLNWRPRRFKWTRPFRRKTKSGFCACAITFQTQSKTWRWGLYLPPKGWYWLPRDAANVVPVLTTGKYHNMKMYRGWCCSFVVNLYTRQKRVSISVLENLNREMFPLIAK